MISKFNFSVTFCSEPKQHPGAPQEILEAAREAEERRAPRDDRRHG